MKRFLAIMLSLVLCFSMLGPVLAADSPEDFGDTLVKEVKQVEQAETQNELSAAAVDQETDLSDEAAEEALEHEESQEPLAGEDEELTEVEIPDTVPPTTETAPGDETAESTVPEQSAPAGSEEEETQPEAEIQPVVPQPELTTAMQPAAVFSAAKASPLNLHVGHETGEDEPATPPAPVELRKDDDGQIMAFVKVNDANIDMGDGFSGTGWYNYGKVSLDGIDLPEEPVLKESIYLDTPVCTEINGNKVYWTTLKYEDDGWHLDGAVTTPQDIGIVSVQDKTGSFSSDTNIGETRNGWHNLDTAELRALLDTLDLPADGQDHPPAVSQEVAQKLNQYLASKGWSGDVDSISWKYSYAAYDKNWHLDGYLNVEKQQVSTVVADPSGQLYEASNGKLNYADWNDGSSYWHDIAKDEFLLPDPGAYEAGDTINLTPVQLKQVQDKFAEVTGWDESGERDGTIEWKFQAQRDSVGKARWDLQGTYVPDTISIYVYMVGAPDMEGMSGTNGNKVSSEVLSQLDKNQEWADEWYTAGKMKLALTDELKSLLNDNDMDGVLAYVKANGAGLLSVYEPNSGFWEDKNFNSLEWTHISSADGAVNYINSVKYKTLHLNGVFHSVSDSGDTKDPVDPNKPIDPNQPVDPVDPNQPGDPANPTDPSNPGGNEGGEGGEDTGDDSGTDGEGGDTPVTPPVPAEPIVPSSPDYTPSDPDTASSAVVIEDQQTPLEALPKELWVSTNNTAYIYGRSATTLNPNETLLRSEFAVLLYRLLSTEAHAAYDTTENTYTDVTAADWYNTAVSTLSAMKVLDGFADGGYHPEAPVTYDTLVAALSAMFQVEENFDYGFASYADEVTRAQIVVLLNRLTGREIYEGCVPENPRYTDIHKEDDYYWDMLVASTDLDN